MTRERSSFPNMAWIGWRRPCMGVAETLWCPLGRRDYNSPSSMTLIMALLPATFLSTVNNSSSDVCRTTTSFLSAGAAMIPIKALKERKKTGNDILIRRGQIGLLWIRKEGKEG